MIRVRWSHMKLCREKRRNAKIKRRIKLNQLKYGIKVELEHKPTFKFIKQYAKVHGRMPSDRMIAKKIAQNHLAENKSYYTKIKKYKL
jgi:hypothetical protein